MTTGFLPTCEDLRTILASHVPGSRDVIDDDEMIHLDSLSLIWLLHVLGECYNICIDPDDPRLVDFTSMARIERIVGEISGRSM